MSFALNLYLLSINYHVNYSFMFRTDLSAANSFWIGLESSGYEWVNGTSEFINWEGGYYPYHDGTRCALTYAYSYEWRNTDCASYKRYICKKEIGKLDTENMHISLS